MLNQPTRSIHICPLYKEVTSLITPVLDQAFRPSEMVLLTSSHVTETSRYLIRALTALGISVSTCEISDEWDPANLGDIMTDLVRLHHDKEILVNISSCTVALSSRITTLCEHHQLAVYYVNPENDTVTWLTPQNRGGFDLQEKLGLEHYFIAHGIDRQAYAGSAPPAGAYCQAATELATIAVQNKRSFAAINHLATHSIAPHFTSRISSQFHNNKSTAIIDTLTRHNLAQLNGDHLTLANQEVQRFTAGGWLEIHVQNIAERLRKRHPDIHDIKRGVTIRKVEGKDEITNEIDVAVFKDNRLHMIECKTGGEQLKLTDSLYKLDALRSFLGDEHAKAMLVSIKPATSAIQHRAEQHNITLCTGKDLSFLEEIMTHWMAKGHT